MKITTRLRSLLASTGGRVGRYILIEQLLGLFARPIDVLMFYFIVSYGEFGISLSFYVGGALYLPLCVGVVYLNDLCQRNGYDLTGIDELREKAGKSKLASWILRRRATIFLIGSWCKLDPDYVTLLLRNKEKSFWTNALRITVPSVILSMAVWTSVYWGVYKGYTLALWFYNHG